MDKDMENNQLVDLDGTGARLIYVYTGLRYSNQVP
jgi:hypothetical protein